MIDELARKLHVIRQEILWHVLTVSVSASDLFDDRIIPAKIVHQWREVVDTNYNNLNEHDKVNPLRWATELAAVKDPWTYIEEERPETLPPYIEYTKVIITQLVDNELVSKAGYYDGFQFGQVNGSFIPFSSVVAWQPWPEPTPLPEGVK